MSSIGNNAIVAVALKDNKGDIPTTWRKIRARTAPLDDTAEQLKSEALTGNRFKEKGMTIALATNGNITTEGNREELKIMLMAAGFDIDTSVADQETYSASQSILKWLDFIIYRTDVSLKEKFKDCRIDSIQIDISAKSFTTIQYAIEGISTTRGGTLDETISLPEDPRFVCLDAKYNFNGTDISAKVRDISLKINNNLDKEDYPINSIERESLDAQSSTIELSGTVEFNKTDFEAYKTQLKETSSVGVIIDLDSKVKAELSEFTFTEVSAPVDTADKIRISFNGEASLPSNGGTPLKFIVDTTAY